MAHIAIYGPEGLWKGSILKPVQSYMGQRPSGPGQDGPYSHIYPYIAILAHIAIYGVYGPEGLYLDGRHWALEPVLGVYGPKALRARAPGTPIWDP